MPYTESKGTIGADVSEALIDSKGSHDHSDQEFFEETQEEHAARVQAILAKYSNRKPEDLQGQQDGHVRKAQEFTLKSRAFDKDPYAYCQSLEASTKNAGIVVKNSDSRSAAETEADILTEDFKPVLDIDTAIVNIPNSVVPPSFMGSAEAHGHPAHDFIEETAEEFASRVQSVLAKYKEPAGILCQGENMSKKEEYLSKIFIASNEQGENIEPSNANIEIVRAPNASTAAEADTVDRLSLAYRKPNSLWNTAIFFPDKNPRLSDSATNRLLFYFQDAKMSIQICCFLASFLRFERIILEKKKQGLCIQVITDHDTMEAHYNSSCHAFEKARISVWTRNTGCFMHNKFAIIDDEAVLTGSLNYTKTAFSTNFENVLVTTDERIVDAYRKRYNYLLCEIEKAHKTAMEALESDFPTIRQSRRLPGRIF